MDFEYTYGPVETWFAWHPVRIWDYDRYVWLTHVKRFRLYRYGLFWGWGYLR